MSELLTCEGLTKSYQKGTNALDSIDLHIGFGRIVGLLGPNGSGKTTLIKLANGLLQPTAGSIKVAGMAPGPDTGSCIVKIPFPVAQSHPQEPLEGKQGEGPAHPRHEPERPALSAG